MNPYDLNDGDRSPTPKRLSQKVKQDVYRRLTLAGGDHILVDAPDIEAEIASLRTENERLKKAVEEAEKAMLSTWKIAKWLKEYGKD
jgi:hypothetical protein